MLFVFCLGTLPRYRKSLVMLCGNGSRLLPPPRQMFSVVCGVFSILFCHLSQFWSANKFANNNAPRIYITAIHRKQRSAWPKSSWFTEIERNKWSLNAPDLRFDLFFPVAPQAITKSYVHVERSKERSHRGSERALRRGEWDCIVLIKNN